MDQLHRALITAIAELMPDHHQEVESCSLDDLLDYIEAQLTDAQREALQGRVTEIIHSGGELS